MNMNASALTMRTPNMPISSAASLLVMNMAKENMEQQGQNLVDMLNTTVAPIAHPEGSFDIKI